MDGAAQTPALILFSNCRRWCLPSSALTAVGVSALYDAASDAARVA